MTILSEASALFDEWIAAVAGAIDSMIGRYAPRPQIVLGGESTGRYANGLIAWPQGHEPAAGVPGPGRLAGDLGRT